MGRPNPVLTIVHWQQWCGEPAIEELRAQGHNVVRADYFDWREPVDLILHPANWDEELFVEKKRESGEGYRPFVMSALAGARARRRKRKA